MGQTLSGIILDHSFKTVNSIEKRLGCKFKLIKESDYRGEKSQCKVYFLKNGILMLLHDELASEPYGVSEGTCMSFILSDTADAYSYNLCEGRNLKRAFKSMAGERFEESGDATPVETEVKDDYSFILESIKKITTEDLYDIINIYPYQSYHIDLFPNKVNFPSDESVIPPKKVIEARKNYKSIVIQAPNQLERPDELFEQLSNDDSDVVLNALSGIQASDINTHTLTYLIVIFRFHWETKVRNAAKKLVKQFASDSLWEQLNVVWNSKDRNIQGYHEKKEYYEHEHIHAGEYFLFAYLNRRNFFTHRPMKGMYNVYSAMTGNKDEIKNVFECYGSHLLEIPEKVKTQEHIGVAKIMFAPNLNFENAIDHLAQLPNLHNLYLWKCGLTEVPKNIGILSKLKSLELYKNSLEKLPENIYFPNMIYLGISDNKINHLNLEQFPQLDFLQVDQPYSIKFDNVKKPFKVGFGKQIYEEVTP
ncbi:hypothetical protein BKI52_16950 [marine bacterium AO1-C]|nr:hypothetical protein BKI52_16950 [marine bacterium AO1-C]